MSLETITDPIRCCTVIFTDCALAILQSVVEPREAILYLAREMKKVPDNGNERILAMKLAMTESLQKMSPYEEEFFEEDSISLDERYLHLADQADLQVMRTFFLVTGAAPKPTH